MIFSERYRQEDNLWIPTGQYTFQYSDGDQVENYILSAIQHTSDISIGSEELFSQIKDWPSLYHLSPKRADLLRPIAGFLNNKKILEIGSGCGAITRFLGELNCEVLALEGSLRRAKITRERCRDLQNVNVLADSFDDFVTGEKFDCITLIGVLEYSNLFVRGDNPPLAMVQRAKQLLNPGGFIIIAIENKVGLKYLGGAPEDHIGLPFVGIENRYGSDTAVTFGKKELEFLLQEAGLSHSQFLYPFPDYKLPVTVLTDKGFRTPGFDAPGLLLEKQEYVQERQYNSFFNLSLVGRELYKNGLAGDVANSFLVLATEGEQPVIDPSLLAVSYSTSRKKPYCKAIEFHSNTDGAVYIDKRKLHPGETIDGSIRFNIDTEPYKPGELLQEKLLRIISEKNWTLTRLVEWASQYYEVLKGKSRAIDERLYLEGKYIDLTPFNIIVEPGGEIFIFDQEWDSMELLSIEYVFFRGIYYSLGQIVFFNAPEHGVPGCQLELSLLLLEKCANGKPGLIEEFRIKEKTYFSSVWMKRYEPFQEQSLRIRKYDLIDVDAVIRQSEQDFGKNSSKLGVLEPLSVINSQVYWAKESEDFNEANSTCRQIQLTSSGAMHLLKLDQDLSSIKKIRIDLANQQGVFYLHDVSIADRNGKVIFDWPSMKRDCITHNLVLIRSRIIANAFFFLSTTDDPVFVFELPATENSLNGDEFSLMITVSTQDTETIVRELNSLTEGELKRGLNRSADVYYLKDALQSTISDFKNKIGEWHAEREKLTREIALKEEEAAAKNELLLELQKRIEILEQRSIIKLIKSRLISSKK